MVLRRYTDLPSLLAILQKSEITLLPPSSWDDRNDRRLMEAYAKSKHLKTLLALCFSQCAETYHHWKVFAPGNAGVCVEFDGQALLRALPSKGLSHGSVKYKTIKELDIPNRDVKNLPFMKRRAFKDEEEYRLVFESKSMTHLTMQLPVPLSTIKRIVINPWAPEALFEATRHAVCSLKGCGELYVVQSKLIDSPAWRRFADEYA